MKLNIEEIIKEHGGQSALARKLGLTPQHINNWRIRKSGVPPRVQLKHPDIFLKDFFKK